MTQEHFEHRWRGPLWVSERRPGRVWRAGCRQGREKQEALRWLPSLEWQWLEPGGHSGVRERWSRSGPVGKAEAKRLLIQRESRVVPRTRVKVTKCLGLC